MTDQEGNGREYNGGVVVGGSREVAKVGNVAVIHGGRTPGGLRVDMEFLRTS